MLLNLLNGGSREREPFGGSSKQGVWEQEASGQQLGSTGSVMCFPKREKGELGCLPL